MRDIRILGAGFLLSATISVSGTAQTASPKGDSLHPFGPVPPFTRWDSTDWQGRVVIGEYMTGTGCPACKAHDLAFEALSRRYPARVFIPLAYHGSGNVPLAYVADSLWERLSTWYSTGLAHGPGIIPNLGTGGDNWINGRSTSGSLDFSSEGQYARAVEVIDAELQKPPEAFLRVRARAEGGKVVATVDVDSLRGTHPLLYLRILVVEDTIPLRGRRKAPVVQYLMPVRGVAWTKDLPLGLPLRGPGETKYTFDLAAAQKRQLRYYERGKTIAPDQPLPANSVDPDIEPAWFAAQFPDERDWRITPARLHVVAFVQDGKTGEVLQAQMVKVDARAAWPRI